VQYIGRRRVAASGGEFNVFAVVPSVALLLSILARYFASHRVCVHNSCSGSAFYFIIIIFFCLLLFGEYLRKGKARNGKEWKRKGISSPIRVCVCKCLGEKLYSLYCQMEKKTGIRLLMLAFVFFAKT